MHEFLQHILRTLEVGAILIIPAVVICIAALVVAFIVTKKRGRGFNWLRAAAILILCGWFVLTVYVTLLRGENMSSYYNFQLFLAWQEAWNQFTLQVWLNVLLNIALFVPLGVLPLVFRYAEKWYLMLATGFLTSLAIESIQLVTRRGMFDVDDLFTNTVGAMFGWGLIMAARALIRRGDGWKRRCLASAALPAVVILSISSIFVVYALKPYGNFPDAPTRTAQISRIDWRPAFTPSDTAETAWIYEVGRLSQAESDEFAADFAREQGTEFPDTYYYDDFIMYANHSTGDFLDLYQQNGTWSYKIGRDRVPTFDCEPTEVDRDTLASLLAGYGVVIPPEATFEYEPLGSMYNAIFDAALIPSGDDYYYGTVTCRLGVDGGTTLLQEISNSMVIMSPSEEVSVCSQSDALERLYAGHSFYGTRLEYCDGYIIEVVSCELELMADTKGYYQPVWRIELMVGNEQFIDYVPAR